MYSQFMYLPQIGNTLLQGSKCPRTALSSLQLWHSAWPIPKVMQLFSVPEMERQRRVTDAEGSGNQFGQ